MIWMLIGYMWLFIHRPFEIWPVLGAFRMERAYMIGTIICWLVSSPRLPGRNLLHWSFTLFILAMLLSWSASPYQRAGDATVENYLKYSVFYVLLVTSVKSESDLRKLLVGHVCVITLLMAHSLREYANGRHHFAQGIVRLVPVGASYDFNDLAGLIVCSLPLSWVLWREWRGTWKLGALLGHYGLAGVCVMLTGSRMGFVGLVLASILACLASPYRWRLLVIYPAALACVWLALPEDRQNRYLTLIDPSAGPAEAAASAGNLRSSGFTTALPIFESSPWLGFGPNSFGSVTGKGMMPHNVYGQLLAELGLAGAFTFGLILWGVARNVLAARRLNRICNASPWDVPVHTAFAAGCAVLMLVIMGWGFNFLYWHVWLWFGGFQVVALQMLRKHAAHAQLLEDDEAAEARLPIENAWT